MVIGRKLILLAALALLMPLTPVLAADGVFMVVKGDIKLEKAGKASPAKVGMKVEPGDIVIAGKDSRAKVVMKDNNVLNISPESKLKIEAYDFDPEKDKKNVSLNLLYGKVRSTVNQKYEGENKFRIKTPSAVAGVRGTDFLTNFNQETKVSQIVTFEGKVEVGSGVGAGGQILNPVQVSPGQMTVASAGVAPAPPAPVPASQLASMESESKAAPGNDRQPASGNEPKPEKQEKQEKQEKAEKAESAKAEGDNKGRNESAKAEGDNGRNDSAKQEGDNGRNAENGPGPNGPGPNGPGPDGERSPASVGEGPGSPGPGGMGPGPDGGMAPPGDMMGGPGPMPGPDMMGGGDTFAPPLPTDGGGFMPDPQIGPAPIFIPPDMAGYMPAPIGPVLDPGLIQNNTSNLIINITY